MRHGAQVPPRIWRNVLFPLGSMRKEQVRQLAESLGLRVASKKSSTGLCFVGKRRFGDFIGQYLVDRPGEIRCVDDGRVRLALHQGLARCALSEPRAAAQRVGEHRGLWRYTLGQGARIGGSAQKYFVARKDMERRTLVSGCRRWPTAIPAADAAARSGSRRGAATQRCSPGPPPRLPTLRGRRQTAGRQRCCERPARCAAATKFATASRR